MKKIPRFFTAIACTFLSCLPAVVFGQDLAASHYTDISKIGLLKFIDSSVSSTYVPKDFDLQVNYKTINFLPGLRHRANVPNSFVSKKAVLQFHVCNSADTAVSVYFFPGFYYDDIELYSVETESLERLPTIMPGNEDSIGYRLLTILPHDSITLLAGLRFVKTYINTIKPRLINVEYLSSYISALHGIHNRNDLVTYVFCGLLLMMILFSMANFLQGANPEFLYYSGYAFFLGAMLFTKAMFDFHSSRISFFLESYLDFIMQGLGIMFYMFFMQWFLDTRRKYRFLFNLYSLGIILLIVSLGSYTFLHFFTNNFSAENGVENATKVLLLLMNLLFLGYAVQHWSDRLLRYLFWGNLCLFGFSLFSQVVVMLDPRFRHLPGIFNSSLFYYEIGLLLELVFFLAALNYKNNKTIIEQTQEREGLKAENLLKEYEKELAVYKAQQEERERISADMHDELGSGMTAIRLLSEIARNKMKENTPVEIEKISHSANDVLNKMNAIIWSMNIGNDTLDNLISYIRAYALEYFDNTPIQCKVNTATQIPDRELSGDKRRNIFLCVKETLNNVWKHSGCTEVTIDIETKQGLLIRIEDNGRGIDLQHLRQFGNGLKNINRRMESIGGQFSIENHPGAVTTLHLPF